VRRKEVLDGFAAVAVVFLGVALVAFAGAAVMLNRSAPWLRVTFPATADPLLVTVTRTLVRSMGATVTIEIPGAGFAC